MEMNNLRLVNGLYAKELDMVNTELSDADIDGIANFTVNQLIETCFAVPAPLRDIPIFKFLFFIFEHIDDDEMDDEKLMEFFKEIGFDFDAMTEDEKQNFANDMEAFVDSIGSICKHDEEP